MRLAATCLAALAAAAPAATAAYEVVGDAIPEPLTRRAGDAVAGAALAADRQKSLCVLCHGGPFAPAHLQGTLAPDLSGVGDRLSAGQIRLRIVDMKRLSPETIMPAYLETAGDGDRRVAAAWRGRTILTPDEIEDLVAYLSTLRG